MVSINAASIFTWTSYRLAPCGITCRGQRCRHGRKHWAVYAPSLARLFGGSCRYNIAQQRDALTSSLTYEHSVSNSWILKCGEGRDHGRGATGYRSIPVLWCRSLRRCAVPTSHGRTTSPAGGRRRVRRDGAPNVGILGTYGIELTPTHKLSRQTLKRTRRPRPLRARAHEHLRRYLPGLALLHLLPPTPAPS